MTNESILKVYYLFNFKRQPSNLLYSLSESHETIAELMRSKVGMLLKLGCLQGNRTPTLLLCNSSLIFSPHPSVFPSYLLPPASLCATRSAELSKEDCTGNRSPAGSKAISVAPLSHNIKAPIVYGVILHKQYYIILFELYGSRLT